MRVAVATSQDVATILRAPYRRTLWTFYHLQQLDYVADLKRRGNAIDGANLNAIAFHKPEKLGDEQRRLMNDAGQIPTAATSIESAQWLIEAVAKVDAHEAREAAQANKNAGGAS